MKKYILILITTIAFSQNNINDIGNYNFPDFPNYTKWKTTTTLSSGLNITTTTNEFINTGKFVDNSVYSITITGTCAVNNASHFGFGIKNGNNFSSILYRGSNGAVEELNYNNVTLKTPAWRVSGTTYAVGDVVSVKVYFQNNNIFWKVSKNGVWQQETTATKTFLNTGELVIVIRSASQWSNIYANVETYNNFSDCYISEFGNDANSGTQESPVKSIAKAKDITKGTGIIYAKSGTYYDDYTFDLRRSFSLIGEPGTKFVYGERISQATLVNGVYEFVRTPLNGDFANQKLWLDGVNDGRKSNYQLNYSTNLNNVTSGWSQANGKIYFKVPFALDLSINNLVLPSRGNFTNNFHYAIGNGTTSSNINIQNIEIYYANLQLYNTTFSLVGVKAGCVSTKAVFEYGYNFNSYFETCEAFGANFTTGGFGDGFSATANNYILNGYNTIVVIYNCYSHDNQDDGFTNHGGTYVSYTNCNSEYNKAGITPASGGDCEIKNCIVQYNYEDGINCVGSPLDGSATTRCIVSNSFCVNNGKNYYLYPQHTGLEMIATDCTSVQGPGTHFAPNVTQINCIIINN